MTPRITPQEVREALKALERMGLIEVRELGDNLLSIKIPDMDRLRAAAGMSVAEIADLSAETSAGPDPRGFVWLHESIDEWPTWTSLDVEDQTVAIVIVLSVGDRPRTHKVGDGEIALETGEMLTTLEAIARRGPRRLTADHVARALPRLAARDLIRYRALPEGAGDGLYVIGVTDWGGRVRFPPPGAR